MTVPILSVEDVRRHYIDVTSCAKTAARALGMKLDGADDLSYTIEQVLGDDMTEARLQACEGLDTVPLVIFDIHMEHEGRVYDLDATIEKLWNAPPDAWRSQIPIIIYTVFDFSSTHITIDLQRPLRANNVSLPRGVVIPKLPRGEEQPWDLLTRNIRVYLHALLQSRGVA